MDSFPKSLNGFVKMSETKADPRYVTSKCGMTHNNSSLAKKGIPYGSRKELFKKERDHDEVFEDTW